MKKILFYILVFFFMGALNAQNPEKQYTPLKVLNPPKIDGLLEDEAWMKAAVISDMIQSMPQEGHEPTQRTEVRVVYDDNAIYVAAMLYDTAPDSIKHELGIRDDAEINADLFKVGFDPYNNQQDAYIFEVYASGVQKDSRVLDLTYNAVWQSAVKINNKGWSVEIAIPYSAIRFPTKDKQSWGFQFARNIARSNEYEQWSLIPKDATTYLRYWGQLKDLENIKAPLRLSLSPFASFYYENAPTQNGTINKYENSFGYSFGADLKYGIDEKFTLDLTLLPDFSQVQSDNKVKNLSYQEIVYNENRSFFQEGTELFTRGSLFYTRRIGRTPMGFNSIENHLRSGEVVQENPSKVKLLNAIKLSGRNNNGLGVGLFNAITDNTYAVVTDTNGNKRKILTEPLSNYNILVFDQQLKNSSSIYVINTNVIRDKGHDDANVTGAGYTFCNKKQSYATDADFALSQRFSKDTLNDNTFDDLLGYTSFLGIRKITGLFQWGYSNSIISKTYDARDLGYYAVTNKMKNRLYLAYNIYKPTKTFLQIYNTLTMDYLINPLTGKMAPGTSINFDNYTQFLNYWTLSAGGAFAPFETTDYDEPRVEGRFSKSFRYYYLYAGFNTDSRKAFETGVLLTVGNFIDRFLTENIIVSLAFRYRVNDRLTFNYTFDYNTDPYNYGFANFDEDNNSIFGTRRMLTLTNVISAKYMFMNDMFASVNVRHYWNTCKYRDYYTLLDNGDIAYNGTYAENNDYNYNVFNVDFMYSWQFAPGSQLSIVYKNAIETQESDLIYDYYRDLKHTIESPQSNSLSLKVMYYLDYQYLKKWKKKK